MRKSKRLFQSKTKNSVCFGNCIWCCINQVGRNIFKCVVDSAYYIFNNLKMFQIVGSRVSNSFKFSRKWKTWLNLCPDLVLKIFISPKTKFAAKRITEVVLVPILSAMSSRVSKAKMLVFSKKYEAIFVSELVISERVELILSFMFIPLTSLFII